MRDLIRPTLFIIARAGLCLAVVAWIAGQWREANVLVRVDFQYVLLSVSSSGVEGRIIEKFPGPYFAHHLEDYIREHNYWNRQLEGLVYAEPLVQVAGFVVWDGPVRWSIHVRHWLIVTFFALFNVLLWWVYRKRAVAADE